ncbi:hypothetical protein HanXRQr2_Chr16g0773611 [Helianthus annuus]|uniref:Uncharacterized protein n=1 Tax=Helianthus annuus TaxID=4232 RepID=A0A9K3DX45_HELAN|nr:hypothetical protein HanXRQr2_Chr16g0773611 [Helianthus annuus]
MVIICINTHFFKSVVFFLSGYFHSVTVTTGGFGNSVKVSVELVVEAVNLEPASQPFEVVCHPRASTPEF